MSGTCLCFFHRRELCDGEDGSAYYSGQAVLCCEGGGLEWTGKIAELVGEVPGEVARLHDVPEGEDAADFAGVLGEYAEGV